MSLLLILIIALALLLRVFFLDRIPVGLTNDEINFVLNAKAIFLTGKDVAQIWNPLSLTTITGQFPRAELPYLLLAPFIGPMDFSLFTARLPYALTGTGIIVLLILISWKLFGKTPAFFIGLVAAINPWSIFFSRTAFEAPLAIFFFFLGFYLLLLTKGWRILFAMIPFFIGFYCYMGTKLIFIPMILIFLVYSWKVIHKGRYLYPHLLLFFLCLLTALTFLFRYTDNSAHTTRGNELYLPFSSTINKKVDQHRKLSIQTPLIQLQTNKISIYLREGVEKYFGAFSPKLLFTNGDDEIHQSLFYHGNFYYLDVIFLIVGLYYLFRHHKKTFFFIISLILIAPLPSVASNASLSYGLRSALLFPLLLIVIGLGMYAVVTTVFFQKHKVLLSSILIGIYLIMGMNFLSIYFFQYPIYNAEATNFSWRVLSKYIVNESQHKKLIVINSKPEEFFSAYLFYTNLYNASTKEEVAQQYRGLQRDPSQVTFGNVTIMKCPISNMLFLNETVIIAPGEKCATVKTNPPVAAKTQLAIGALNDGHILYILQNANYCNNISQENYPHDITFSDLNVEKLPQERFCNKFILKSL